MYQQDLFDARGSSRETTLNVAGEENSLPHRVSNPWPLAIGKTTELLGQCNRQNAIGKPTEFLGQCHRQNANLSMFCQRIRHDPFEKNVEAGSERRLPCLTQTLVLNHSLVLTLHL